MGVHTGQAYVGTVGQAQTAWDFTALGDAVNTTARLAGQATAGEVLASIDAARAAGLDLSSLPTRSLEVRGRREPVDVVSLGPGSRGRTRSATR